LAGEEEEEASATACAEVGVMNPGTAARLTTAAAVVVMEDKAVRRSW